MRPQILPLLRRPVKRYSDGTSNPPGARRRPELIGGGPLPHQNKKAPGSPLRSSEPEEGVGLAYASTGQSKIMRGERAVLATSGHSDGS